MRSSPSRSCGFGAGLVLWAKRFMPAGPEIEERGQLASTEEEVAAFKEDFDVGEYQLERRSLLTKLMVGAGAALGLAALFPIQSLGPAPRPVDDAVAVPTGTRLVDEQGHPITPDRLKQDGILTVFPEGDLDDEYAQTVLIRLRPVEGLHASVGPRGLDGRQPGRVLEGVHARRLPGRAVRGAVRHVAVPVPPVDVRRVRRRAPGLRAGRGVAAAAAARRSTTTAT